mmetsp:Transcript_1047/g.1731  ORF Transcript_1047/g.1731 Transcript_1047/m.1731 type:complete len:85 (-) Transcript_1047:188-442(-)
MAVGFGGGTVRRRSTDGGVPHRRESRASNCDRARAKARMRRSDEAMSAMWPKIALSHGGAPFVPRKMAARDGSRHAARERVLTW